MKIGFLVGWLASFLPVAAFIFLFVRMAASLADWLAGMVYRIRLPLPGDFGFDINVVELLHLQEALSRLEGWAAIGGLVLFLLILLVTSLFGLFWGIIAAVAGVVFNLLSRATGGVELTLAENQLSESG